MMDDAKTDSSRDGTNASISSNQQQQQHSANEVTRGTSAKHINKLADIGINLTHRALIKHWEAVIQRGIDVGVTTILLTGTSMKSSKQNLDLAKTWNEK
eukprot:CAMPEP_0185737876 /NCGR_PEP_ID=MMETSP1171-20130828/31490_1 /TAXON_ID=374046 /ORGANISM="Helicotheca tamensis, Strain CCMP826" /LENGTH=98 /DNA_ID=CAMNT_0028408911 /DNA_START=185 /DNA_END=478 /DNA_ORIENTATION=+